MVSEIQSGIKKVYLMITANGILIVLTSYHFIKSPAVLNKITGRGIDKFIAYELPLNFIKELYGESYYLTLEDLHQSDEFRVLDESGERVFKTFQLKYLGTPIYYDGSTEK